MARALGKASSGSTSAPSHEWPFGTETAAVGAGKFLANPRIGRCVWSNFFLLSQYAIDHGRADFCVGFFVLFCGDFAPPTGIGTRIGYHRDRGFSFDSLFYLARYIHTGTHAWLGFCDWIHAVLCGNHFLAGKRTYLDTANMAFAPSARNYSTRSPLLAYLGHRFVCGS